jgi:hypothetical protein
MQSQIIVIMASWSSNNKPECSEWVSFLRYFMKMMSFVSVPDDGTTQEEGTSVSSPVSEYPLGQMVSIKRL